MCKAPDCEIRVSSEICVILSTCLTSDILMHTPAFICHIEFIFCMLLAYVALILVPANFPRSKVWLFSLTLLA
jgi:hypothetical protein